MLTLSRSYNLSHYKSKLLHWQLFKLLILDTNLNRPREEDGVVADGEASGEAADVGQEAGNQLDTGLISQMRTIKLNSF